MDSDFPQLKNQCFLDCAGSLPAPKPILDQVFKELQDTLYGNPHSTNPSSIETSGRIHSVRKRLLNYFNTNDYSIVFTLNATHAISKISDSFDIQGRIVILDRCHTSVIGMAIDFAAKQGTAVDDALVVKTEQEIQDWLSNTTVDDDTTLKEGGLFVFPAQCNFSGQRYPLDWVGKAHQERKRVLVDISSLVSTTPIDLSKYKPEFLVLSFYKMFGYPTGLGALIVRNDLKALLRKRYFGGGTVSAIAVNPFYVSLKQELHECLEDGTIPFQQIIALDAGFDYIKSRWGKWDCLLEHCNHLANQFVKKLSALTHYNKSPVARVFRDSRKDYGPIVSFVVLDSLGEIVGYSEVMRLAVFKNIHIRSGRFCNPGGAQHYLQLSSESLVELRETYGHVCGDENDKVDGKATGALRVSFGFCNTDKDITTIVSFFKEYFVETEPISFQAPVHERHFQVLETFIYPIKSCGGFRVTNWLFSSTGLLYDRHFMLIDKNGNVLNQRKHPQLKRIFIVDVDLKSKLLEIGAPGMCNLVIPLLGTGLCLNTTICSTKKVGIELEEKINHWFCEYLGLECALLRVPYSSQTSFANKAPFLAIVKSSLDSLVKSIKDSSHIGVHSFRPNFVITGEIPFSEVEWVGTTISLGSFSFKVQDLCERCQMICIDEDGQRHAEPLLTLAKQRIKGKIVFGVYLQFAVNLTGLSM